MKLRAASCAAILLAFVLTGCRDRVNVEDVTFALLIGIDLDEQDRLVFSLSSPVFSKEAKKKEEEFVVRADTMRSSREEFDRSVVAMTMGGKVQAILLGKRLLSHPGWFELLDPFYRDNKNTVLPTVVMVDGPVSEIIRYSPEDKPRLPTYLSELIRTANRRNLTVNTTLQQLHRQMFEKGMTASVVELRKDGNLKLMGTALLDENGVYALTLNPAETKLFGLLKPGRSGEFPITLAIPSRSDGSLFRHDQLSFNTSGIRSRTKVGYAEGRFRFDVRLTMKIMLSERLFPFNVEKKAGTLEKEIARKLESDISGVIRKYQQAKVDPVGFGVHARARQYRQWKRVRDRWGDTFADADVNVDVKVRIMGVGAIK